MPYLHWDSCASQDERRDTVKSIQQNGKAGYHPDWISISGNQKSLESKLIQRCLFDSLPLHIRRTLHQFYYETMEDTEVRDGSQVVSRYAKERGMRPNILMVDQLWLWILNAGMMQDLYLELGKCTDDGIQISSSQAFLLNSSPNGLTEKLTLQRQRTFRPQRLPIDLGTDRTAEGYYPTADIQPQRP